MIEFGPNKQSIIYTNDAGKPVTVQWWDQLEFQRVEAILDRQLAAGRANAKAVDDYLAAVKQYNLELHIGRGFSVGIPAKPKVKIVTDMGVEKEGEFANLPDVDVETPQKPANPGGALQPIDQNTQPATQQQIFAVMQAILAQSKVIADMAVKFDAIVKKFGG